MLNYLLIIKTDSKCNVFYRSSTRIKRFTQNSFASRQVIFALTVV